MRSVPYFFLPFLIIAGFAWETVAQQGRDYEYNSELIWGVTKASNSGLIGGFMLKYNSKLKDKSYHGFGVEIVNVKHPQEQKVISDSGSKFIFGKENYLYSMRFSYNRETVFFRKAPYRGVQINGIVAIGPTLGIEVPYYVKVAIPGGNTIKEPFGKYLRSGNGSIVGPGNFLQGIGESSVVLGLNTKLGISFEFGTFKSDVVGIEIGFQSDLFTRKIILMPTKDNGSFFPSSYLTLFFGSRK